MSNKWSKYTWMGLIGTLLFHGLIIVLLVIFGFSTPLPLPEEEGVMVNLGYSNQGSGPVQPKQPAQSQPSQPETSPSSSEPEDVATQNTEPAPAINNTKSDNKESEQPKETNTEKDKPEEPEINKNALYPGSQNSDGGSEGETGEPGDQGHRQGDPNANNHEGTPGGGGGVNFSLSGRYAKKLPKPSYDSQEQGKVVVKIWVDQQGNVVRAEPQLRGSTTTDSRLQRIAKKAAMRASFSSRAKAAEVQTGTITYNFILMQ